MDIMLPKERYERVIERVRRAEEQGQPMYRALMQSLTAAWDNFEINSDELAGLCRAYYEGRGEPDSVMPRVMAAKVKRGQYRAD